MDVDKTREVIKHRQEGTAHILVNDFSKDHPYDAWDWFISLTPEKRATFIKAAYAGLPQHIINRIEGN